MFEKRGHRHKAILVYMSRRCPGPGPKPVLEPVLDLIPVPVLDLDVMWFQSWSQNPVLEQSLSRLLMILFLVKVLVLVTAVHSAIRWSILNHLTMEY